MKKILYTLLLATGLVSCAINAEPYKSVIIKRANDKYKTIDSFTQYLNDRLPYDIKFDKELHNKALVYKVLDADFKLFSEDEEIVFNSKLEKNLKALEQDDAVLYAEPDIRLHIFKSPDDNRYLEQWQYFDPNGGINMEKAWNITTGSDSITVAVIDSGVVQHSDYAYKIVQGRNFVDGEDVNDYIDKGMYIPQYGYSIFHGSHVAGTIAAGANNGGVVGVSWGAKILPVKVLGNDGSGSLSRIIEGMLWASGLGEKNDNPAQVLNLSLGGKGVCSSAMQDAINDIVAKNINIVVSAGNDNSPADFFTPASCDKVITVAATNKAGTKSSYSNYGSKITIAAPGGETRYRGDPDGILSTHDVGEFYLMQGTSMSAPHVAGAISLLLSVNPKLTPEEITTTLKKSAHGDVFGVGLLDVFAALNLVVKTPGDGKDCECECNCKCKC